MTFYWWSHWFWITTSLPVVATVLILLLPNAITHVHTYPNPSQHEISLTFNSNSNTQHETVYSGSDDGDGAHRLPQAAGGGSPTTTTTTITTTKLHQTTTNVAWATSSPLSLRQSYNNANVMDLTIKPSVLILSSIPTFSRSSLIGEKEHKRSADYQANVADRDGGNRNTNDDDNGDANKKPSAVAVAVATAAAAESGDLDAEGSQAIAAHELNNYTTNLKSNSSTKTTTTTTTTLMPTTKGISSKLQADDSGITRSFKEEMAAAAAAATTTTTAAPDLLPGAALPPPVPGAGASAPATPQIDIADNIKDGDDINGIDSHISNGQHRAPFTLENVNAGEELRRAEVEHRERARKSKELSAEYKHINHYINFSSDTKSLLTRSASTAPNEFESDEGNISSEALAIQRTYFLDAGAISAICFTVFGICCTVGTIGIVLYRRRYLNKPQALSEPDSSVYIDDSTMRDNSDEMYSLDNDSFLNSLEAMTIQNYWTDTVKHTKL